ncbi:MAG: AAA family ATPase [Planctomycetota bacterium]
MSLERIEGIGRALRAQIEGVVMGQERTIELMLAALLAEGHLLLEGVPGTAKTLLARTFAASLSLQFSRIQFTPDLMPGDVLGTNLFHFETQRFVLNKGPIFTELLLADEINRAPPKTQAALLEAMQERSVTLDGTTHPLGSGFLVIATQNPIEQEGTYPLPEAQLDRFLFKVRVDFPERQAELEMVRRHGHRTAMPALEEFGLEQVAALEDLQEARRTIEGDEQYVGSAVETIEGVRLAEEMVAYIVDLIRGTRVHPSLLCGASPRAANMLAIAARTTAAIDGRDFVIPDDVKALLVPVLAHRLILAPGAEMEGQSADSILGQVVEQVAAPR